MSSIFGSISGRTSLTSRKDYKITVQLLDDNENIVQEFNKNANGQAVLDYVCEYLNIVEKDYFGLRFQDISKHRYWIDLNKPVTKQIRGSNLGLRFRVRFYPANVNVLQEEITRYQLFVQLQRDLLHGRLYCPQNEAAVLGGLILQSMLGDYDQEERPLGYVSEYKLLLKQTAKIEEKIAEAHKSFKGYTSAEAELEFLQRASKLDTYGFDPFTVMDKQGQTVYVGVTHKGLFVYQTNRMVHHISWDQLDNVNFLGKELVITPTQSYISRNAAAPSSLSNGHATLPAQKVVPLKFKCPSGTFAKHLWRHVLSQQAFFTESEAKKIKTKFSKPRIPLLSRGSSFRYPSSRVLHEIEVQKPFVRNGPLPEIIRYPLPRQQPRHLVRDCRTLPPMHMNDTINSTILESEPLMERTEVWEVAREKDEDKLAEEVNETQASVSLPSAERVTTFTIHLCRRDPLPSVSNDMEKEVNEPEEKVFSPILESDMNPLYASTPIREDVSLNSLPDENEVTHDDEKVVEPVTKTTAKSLVTSDTKCSAQQKAVERSSMPRFNKVAKYLFPCLLVILLLAALVIMLFETETRLISLPIVEDIRHSVYEPLRNYVARQFINNY